MASTATSTKTDADVNAVAPLTPNGWLRYDVIRRLLPDGVTDVLEVGCGQGAFGSRLAQRYRYLGVEPDQRSWAVASQRDRKSTRLNSSHITISYAVFCLKKKK